ncbi:MAG: type II toxin-antitoxin system VapC family toxin [Terriglobales bacterium]
MSVFADTSGLYAVMDSGDAGHPRAAAVWRELLRGPEPLLTTNYVFVEMMALVQARLGLDAVRDFLADMAPVLGLIWVDEPLHRAAARSLILAARRGLSFVDCVSFAAMEQAGARKAFTLDHHFREQGFEVLPTAPEH